MTIKELLVNMYSKNFNILEELEVKHYVPILEKKQFVIGVIAACTDEDDGFVSVDRFKMNVYFNMKALELYTNLEIADNFDDMMVQYDELCEHRVMDGLLNLFEDDYKMMCSVLEGELDTLLVQNSIDAQVVRLANKISKFLDDANTGLSGLDLATILPDVANLTEVLNKLK
jgi:hypothetical protein